MKKIEFLKSMSFPFLAMLLMFACGGQRTTKVSSPNRLIEVKLNLQYRLNYLVTFNKDTIIDNSHISLTLNNETTLDKFEILYIQEASVNEKWERIWGKRKHVENNYNELILHLKEMNSGILTDLYLRVYDDGIGIRYGFPKQAHMDSIILEKENMQFSFTKDYSVWRADYKNYQSPQEEEFLPVNLSDIKKDQLIGMPLLIKLDDKGYALITEANLTNWSGAFLRVDSVKNTMVTDLAPYPQDSSVVVKRVTPAVSPWRVIMIAKEPGKLIESDIIANFNDPLALEDVSWITTGVSAWDWWWSNRYAPGAGFDLGPNQQTMKYFIDFAAEMRWEYQIVDWQWYGEPFGSQPPGVNPNADITTCIDGINVEELVQYANSKGVKLILWVHWSALKNQIDEALPLYEKWGVSGIKIDFMNRQDQEMVKFYHQVAKKAAEHKLIVNFHGAYKPSGVSRTYPNLITREGVMGNEYSKWSNRITPEHNVTLPFTRGLLGEMDYTPVAFRNVRPEDFLIENKTHDGSPVVQSTSCHQLAMSVVYESALAVFCDSPDNYKNGIGTEFLKEVPTTWDDTKVLNASVGDYITIARKAGDKWFIGSMTDADERKLTINFSFLEKGKYKAKIFEDAKNANEYPSEVNYKEEVFTNIDSFSIELAKGGGLVAIMELIEE